MAKKNGEMMLEEMNRKGKEKMWTVRGMKKYAHIIRSHREKLDIDQGKDCGGGVDRREPAGQRSWHMTT